MKKEDVKANENQIRSVYRSLLDSWNNNIASDFANLFAIEGRVIGFDGSQMNGRDQIEKELKEIFLNHKVSSYVSIVQELRSFSPSVYFLHAVAGMVPPDQNEIDSKVNAIQTLVAVKEGSEFKIALFQNTPAAFHGRPELRLQLTEELQEAFKSQNGS